MSRRGRKRRLDIESEYWRLVLSGVGTVEACKRVGIGRKTGYGWRAENGGLPPAPLSEGARSRRWLGARPMPGLSNRGVVEGLAAMVAASPEGGYR